MGSNTKEYSLAYYHTMKHKDAVCECGRRVKAYNLYVHRKTKIHQRHLATLGIPDLETPIVDTPILDTLV